MVYIHSATNLAIIRRLCKFSAKFLKNHYAAASFRNGNHRNANAKMATITTPKL